MFSFLAIAVGAGLAGYTFYKYRLRVSISSSYYNLKSHTYATTTIMLTIGKFL